MIEFAPTATDVPAGLRAPQPGKLAAIDYAVESLGVRSFADLGCVGQVYGQYSYYAFDRPQVERGVLADLKINEWIDEQVAARPGLRTYKGDFTTAEAMADIGYVDAIFFFDVLLHTVDPDWDEMIDRVAGSARCIVVANPQWELDEHSVRLIDLGREGFLNAVPKTQNHDEIFDRLDDWHPLFGRPYRDSMHIWQWGVTDADPRARMGDLGFRLDYYARLVKFWDSNGFVNKVFVFARP